MEKIRIIHTNDLHSHFENWPKIRRFIKERQKTSAEESVVTVDLGDFSDRWHPLTEATDGQGNVAIMNQVHYDVATIGNNEGTGNAKVQLDHLYEAADFDVIVANLFDKEALRPPKWAQPYKILTSKQGTKIGLIALTAYFPLTYSPNGWDIRPWQEILPELVQRLRKNVEVLILLSHLGVEEDVLIAKELPAIDVIIGSHTHHLFEHGEEVNGVLLAAAGKFGLYAGEVELKLSNQKKVYHKVARTYPTQKMLAYPEDAAEVKGYWKKGEELLENQKVAYLPYSLTNEHWQTRSLMDETLKALAFRGNTEAAVLSTGLFLDALEEGVVTQRHLHQILPHPMHLIRVTLSGEDLLRFVLEVEKNRAFLRRYPIVGMGFRGKIFGEVVYRGIQYDATNRQVLWKGKKIKDQQMYTITTVDHFMFVPFFPTIELVGKVEFLFPEFIRGVLGQYLEYKYQFPKRD